MNQELWGWDEVLNAWYCKECHGDGCIITSRWLPEKFKGLGPEMEFDVVDCPECLGEPFRVEKPL